MANQRSESKDDGKEERAMTVCAMKHEAGLFAYCVTDSCYVCEACFELAHRDHSVEYLKFLARDHLKAAQVVEETVSQALARCDSSLSTFSKRRLSECITHSITTFCESVAKQVREYCARLIQQAHDRADEEFGYLERTAKSLSQCKDQLMVTLGTARQQIRVYDKALQQNRYKWFPENSRRLQELQAHAQQLTAQALQTVEELKSNFPKVDFRCEPRDVIHFIEDALTITRQNQCSLAPAGQVSRTNVSKLQEAKSYRPPHSNPAEPAKSLYTLTSSGMSRTSPERRTTQRRSEVLASSASGRGSARGLTKSKTSPRTKSATRVSVTSSQRSILKSQSQLNSIVHSNPDLTQNDDINFRVKVTAIPNANAKTKAKAKAKSKMGTPRRAETPGNLTTRARTQRQTEVPTQRATLPVTKSCRSFAVVSSTAELDYAKSKASIDEKPHFKINLTQSARKAPTVVPSPQRYRPNETESYFVDATTSTLYRINIPSKVATVVALALKKSFPDGYAIVDNKGRLLITGGERNKIIINDVYEINTKSGLCYNKAPMLTHRRNHGSALLQGSVFVLGGYNTTNNIMAKCEKYLWERDEWIDLPPLNKERNFMSCCTFGERYVYVFGGCANEGTSGKSSCEWLDSSTLEGWHWCELKAGDCEVGYGEGSVQISPDTILLFGGLNETEYFRSSALFNVTSGQLRPTTSLLHSKDAFYQRMPVLLDSKVYCVGFLSKSVHTFDLRTEHWSSAPFILRK